MRIFYCRFYYSKLEYKKIVKNKFAKKNLEGLVNIRCQRGKPKTE
jgi:hypothetical protein